MRPFFISLLIFIMFLSLFTTTASAVEQTFSSFPFAQGETIQYDIKKLNMKWGETTMTFQGLTSLKDQPQLLIIVTSKGLKFFDEERIYFDPKSYLPTRIERDLDILGKKEKIVEYYNVADNSVRIVKTTKNKTTEQTIKRSNPLDNIYCFIFRYRLSGEFNAGEKIIIHLPTRDVQFQMTGIQSLRVGDQNFNAHYLQSDPAKYSVWFDATGRKVPLRIDGTVGIGKTAMIIKQYTK